MTGNGNKCIKTMFGLRGSECVEPPAVRVDPQTFTGPSQTTENVLEIFLFSKLLTLTATEMQLGYYTFYIGL